MPKKSTKEVADTTEESKVETTNTAYEQLIETYKSKSKKAEQKAEELARKLKANR